MTWFTAQQVSVNNGQTVVSVVNATSDDIAIAQEAGGLVIGNNPPVEIKRTFLDGGSLKKIELRLPWPYANQTNQPAVAFPTDADLAEATRVLRAVGSDAVTFAEALSQVLSSTAATLTIQTETSGEVTVVPYGKLTADVQALLNTFGDFGVPLYDTDTKNQARTLLGLQPQVTAQPTLDLDFANNEYRVYEPFGLTRKTLTEAITNTRTSVASYNSPFGVAQAAVNIPRIEYNPATGECLGLLCEEQRTNLLQWSEAFNNALWTKENCTIESSSVLSPLLTNASIIRANSSNNAVLRQAIAEAVPNSSYTASFLLKAKEISSVIFYLNSGITTAERCEATFNLLTGQLTGSIRNIGGFSNGQVFIQNYGNGWFRISISATTSNTTSLQARLIITNPSINQELYIASAQLEAGSFPTSYIKTEGSQVTRAADRVIVPTSAPTSGTAFFEGFFRSELSTGFAGLLAHLNGGNYFGLNVPANSNRIRLQTVPSTSTNIESGNIPFGSKFKAAYRWTPSQLTLAVNGVIFGTQTHTGLITPNVIGVRVLGESMTAVSRHICTALGEVPRALSDAELIDLTRL